MAKKDKWKDIQDWATKYNFERQLLKILAEAGVNINSVIYHLPNKNNVREVILENEDYRLFQNHKTHNKVLDWLNGNKDIGRMPKWDIAASCQIEDKNGLILIQAITHEEEFNADDKCEATGENRKGIMKAIEECNKDLNLRLDTHVKLSITSNYQLSNHIAYAWKLANLGIPTVLLYLGYIGDNKNYPNNYIKDHDHWMRILGCFMKGVLPLYPPKISVNDTNAFFQFVVADYCLSNHYIRQQVRDTCNVWPIIKFGLDVCKNYGRYVYHPLDSNSSPRMKIMSDDPFDVLSLFADLLGDIYYFRNISTNILNSINLYSETGKSFTNPITGDREKLCEYYQQDKDGIIRNSTYSPLVQEDYSVDTPKGDGIYIKLNYKKYRHALAEYIIRICIQYIIQRTVDKTYSIELSMPVYSLSLKNNLLEAIHVYEPCLCYESSTPNHSIINPIQVKMS